MDPLGYLASIEALHRCTHWVLGAGVRTHWGAGAGVRLGVRLGVPGFLRGGVGPTEPMVRLRWHHKLREIFLKLKTQWVTSPC